MASCAFGQLACLLFSPVAETSSILQGCPSKTDKKRNHFIFPWTYILKTAAFFILIIMAWSPTQGATKYSLANFEEGDYLQKYLEFYIEGDGEHRSLEELINDQGVAFETQGSDQPRFPFSEQVHWGRLKIVNPLLEIRTLVFESQYPPTQNLDIFLIHDSNVTHIQVGHWREKHPDTLSFRLPALPLSFKPGETTLYVKIKTKTSVRFDFRFWSKDEFLRHSNESNSMLFIWYGILVGLFFFNLFLASLNLDKGFVLYTFNIFFYALAQSYIYGVAAYYLPMSSSPWFSKVFLACFPISLIWSISFSRWFLKIPEMSKFLDRSMIISAGSLIFVVIAIFYDYGIGVRLVTHTSGAFSFLTLICSVVSCSKRYVPAYFFFVAWLVFIVGSLLQIFVSGGIIAPTFYAKYGNLIGSGVQIIILSLALGYKLKIIEVKRRQAEFNSHLIRKDLDAAKVVQDSFLIPELPEIEGYRVKAYYHPSLAVGGDWYSIYDDHENSRLYVMIGDVTGHGIASALVTGSTAGSIMTVFKIFPGDSSPEDMLRHLADTANLNVLDIGRKSERWMTMTFICIDYCFHKAYYLNAGHNASYFKLEDRVKTVIQGSRPLGLSSEPYTKVRQIDMVSGSSFFLYTDGLLENSSVEGVHLDDKKLIEQIKSNSMPELFDELVRTAQNFESSYQTDDTAFILIERKASKAKLKAV